MPVEWNPFASSTDELVTLRHSLFRVSLTGHVHACMHACTDVVASVVICFAREGDMSLFFFFFSSSSLSIYLSLYLFRFSDLYLYRKEWNRKEVVRFNSRSFPRFNWRFFFYRGEKVSICLVYNFSNNRQVEDDWIIGWIIGGGKSNIGFLLIRIWTDFLRIKY